VFDPILFGTPFAQARGIASSLIITSTQQKKCKKKQNVKIGNLRDGIFSALIVGDERQT